MRRLIPVLSLSLVAACASSKWSGSSVTAREAPAYEAAESMDAAAVAAGVEQPVAEDTGPRARAGLLTAGEWDDLKDWPRFTELMTRAGQGEGRFARYAEGFGLNIADRVPVVVSRAGAPVVDAKVRLFDARERVVWEARTDNRGKAELYGRFFNGEKSAGPYGVEVSAGGKRVTRWGIDAGAQLPLELASALTDPSELADLRSVGGLDLMFVVDTTGSMSDELRYLQTELDDVVRRVERHSQAQGQDLDVRLSMNFYRDHGDAYVVRDHAFTSDRGRALTQLRAEGADGGGDTPEAVDEALLNAIEKHDWRQSARARLCFLVLDAPPHTSPAHNRRVQRAVRAAAKKGVRLIPVAASGVDHSTEALLRSLAVATGGTYVFLTDHSGVGGAHLEPTVGKYDVEALNDLMVRLVNERMERAPAAPSVALR
jgi:hypothetical protein